VRDRNRGESGGTIDVKGMLPGDTVTVNGQVFTAVKQDSQPTNVQFKVGADVGPDRGHDWITAANLAAAIAAHGVGRDGHGVRGRMTFRPRDVMRSRMARPGTLRAGHVQRSGGSVRCHARGRARGRCDRRWRIASGQRVQSDHRAGGTGSPISISRSGRAREVSPCRQSPSRRGRAGSRRSPNAVGCGVRGLHERRGGRIP
jgi:hypothetical protein